MEQSRLKHPVVFVHGFDHDPEDPDNSALAENGAFTIWAGHLAERNKMPFEWYSGRAVKDVFKAWRAGYLTSYSWAYQKLAIDAAAVMAANRGYLGQDVICHSLGSRVVLQALKCRPNMFRRVIFLNGAETVDEALPVIKANRQTQFLNVHVSTDDTLDKMGAWFEPKLGKHPCMGNKGLGFNPSLKHLIQIQLDDPQAQAHFSDRYGWQLEGDNPGNISDHLYSYLHAGNWPLYRYFLNNGRV